MVRRPAPLIAVLSLLAIPARAQQAIPVPDVRVDAASARPAATSSPSDRVDDPAELDHPAGPGRAAALTPGAQVRESGGPGQPASIGLRGADPASTLLTLDGVPLNSPFLGGADLSGLALLPLDSLTLTRGGQSAALGSDAVGGVVAARTPSPLLSPGTDVSLSAGSFGTARLKASHGERVGSVAGLAAVGLMHSSGDFPFVDVNGRERNRVHAGVDALDGMLKIEALPAAGHRIALTVEGFVDDRDVPGLEEFPSRTATQRDDRFLAAASWTGPAGEGAVPRGTARAWVRRLGFAYADASPPMGAPIATRLVAWSTGAETSATWVPHRAVAVTAGASGGFDRGDVDDLGSARAVWWRGSAALLGTVEVGRDAWPVRGTVRLRGEWDAGAGLRAIPQACLEADPGRRFHLFADASRAFRMPTIEELHFDAGYVQGNPALKPEDSLTWDAGASFGPREAPWIRAAYFEDRVSNLILFLPRSAYLVRADNSGAALLRGVEASARWTWRWLRLGAAYTFLDARFASGLAMPFRPRHRATADVAATFGPVRITVRGTGQTRFWLDRFESQSEEARFLLDARVEFTPIPEVTLALDAVNLTDKRDAMDAVQYPLPGRAFYGTVRISL
jgi:vitamin B12 transporter